MEIESNRTIINSTIENVFEFLKDARNIEKLLPEKEVKDFSGSETECSFKVQGGVTISLVQEKLEAPNKILMKSGEKSPFPFTLIVHLIEKENNITEGFLHFDGEVNSFLSMMVKKPLTNLFNFMSDKLKEVIE